MEPLRLDTLATQVVAWHNRHPLARRIAAAQVQATGYVLVPAMQAQPPREAAAALSPAATVAAEVGTAGMAGALPAQAERSSAADAATVVAMEPANQRPAEPADHLAEKAADDPAMAFEPQPGPHRQATAGDLVADAATGVGTGAAGGAAAETGAENEADNAAVNAAVNAADPASDVVTEVAAEPAAPVAHLPAPGSPAASPVAAAVADADADADADAAADPHQQPFRLAHSERLVDHTSAAELTRWVLQQGRLLAVKLPAAAPVWQVPRDAARSVPRPGVTELPVSLLLRTATLQVGARRSRLLVGPGIDPAVLGRRLWSAPRVALACLPLLLLPLTAGTAWWLGAQSARQAAARAAPGVATSPQASPPSLSASPSPSASAPAAARAGEATPADAAAAAFTAYAASSANAAQATTDARLAALSEPPVAVEPRQGSVALPPLGPLFSDPRLEPTRQRRLTARAARAAPAEVRAAAAPATVPVAAPAAAPATVPAAEPAAMLPAVWPSLPAAVGAPSPAALRAPTAAFALTTRPLRTAAEAEQVQVAMRTLLTLADSPSGNARQVQRIPVGDDWRVLGGAYESRAAAERARTLLLARGVKTEVTEIPPAAAAAAAAAAVARR